MAPSNALPRNRLLAMLPLDELARLQPKLEPVKFSLREVFLERGGPVSFVLFPEAGWFSHIITLEDGEAGEVGLVGREGMIGLPLLFKDDRSPFETVVQGPGSGLRLSAAAFRDALTSCPALQPLLLRYTLAFQAQISQTAACNGRHHVEQRLARWLLMGRDRADGDVLPMTHEFLATMLGVRRPGVTIAAGSLQKSGLIHYHRGIVEILDRQRLGKAACECYEVVRREFERLLGG